MADVVTYEMSERVVTVTLNRPEARNALSVELREELARSFERAEADDGVDVVILTGADPAFCAGLDLKELATRERSVDDIVAARRGPLPAVTKPVIGAVNGVAVTGGLELALACDFLVASERARFADTHARVGLQPRWGLSVALPAAVGVRRAKELSATGNFLDAATALAWGLVNHVVPHDELLSFCRRLAADIVSNDQRALRRILRTYDEGSLLDGEEAFALEARVASGAGTTAGTDVADRRRQVLDRGRSQLG